MPKIAPSLLSADFGRLEQEIIALEAAGADLLHIDVMDGHFVPNLTFGGPVVARIAQLADIPLDVHFMVTNPQDYIDFCIKNRFEYVSVHYEAVPHLHRLVWALKDGGIKAGVALNPATPVELLWPILPDLDFVLLMSVNPGFGGQKFLPLVYQKLATLQQQAQKVNPGLEIEVDGGVNNQNSPLLCKAGANMLVAGSYILGASDYRQQINLLKNI